MRTRTEFEETFNYFKKKYSSKVPFTIKGGTKGYLITKIDVQNVTILQGKSFQRHKVHRLEQLFTIGTFTGPRNGVIYNRNTTWGHLGMKNAIVDFLEELQQQIV